MSDFKSKLPDLNELTSMASKLFKGIKKSVDEIVDDYKQKRATRADESQQASAERTKKTTATKETASEENPPSQTATKKSSKATVGKEKE